MILLEKFVARRVPSLPHSSAEIVSAGLCGREGRSREPSSLAVRRLAASGAVSGGITRCLFGQDIFVPAFVSSKNKFVQTMSADWRRRKFLGKSREVFVGTTRAIHSIVFVIVCVVFVISRRRSMRSIVAAPRTLIRKNPNEFISQQSNQTMENIIMWSQQVLRCRSSQQSNQTMENIIMWSQQVLRCRSVVCDFLASTLNRGSCRRRRGEKTAKKENRPSSCSPRPSPPIRRTARALSLLRATLLQAPFRFSFGASVVGSRRLPEAVCSAGGLLGRRPAGCSLQDVCLPGQVLGTGAQGTVFEAFFTTAALADRNVFTVKNYDEEDEQDCRCMAIKQFNGAELSSGARAELFWGLRGMEANLNRHNYAVTKRNSPHGKSP